MKTTLEQLATGVADAGGATRQAASARLQVLALVEQFEGMLLTEMLKDFGEGEEPEEGALGLGGSTLSDMMRGEFGMTLSRAGGLGLGTTLADALQRSRAVAEGAGQVGGGRPADVAVPATTHVVRHAPADASALAGLDVVAGDPPVTSAFGYRRDPFTGETRFHRGIDLALAYGSDVRALGGGVIRSAGDRPGYGLTVVVDHGHGRETLYAHLSAIDVTPGQPVEAGQRLAQSGRSGRATGPHLHIEAREFGRPLDVAHLEASWYRRPADTSVGESDE